MSAAAIRKPRATVLPFASPVTALEANLMLRHWIESGQFADLDVEAKALLVIQWYTTLSHGYDTNPVGFRRLAKLSGLHVDTVMDRAAKLQQAGLSVRESQTRVNQHSGKAYRERTVYRVPVLPEVRERAKQIRAKAAGESAPSSSQEPILQVSYGAGHTCPTAQDTLCLSTLCCDTSPSPTPSKAAAVVGMDGGRASSEKPPQKPPTTATTPRPSGKPRWEPDPEQAAAVRRAVTDRAFASIAEKDPELIDRVVFRCCQSARAAGVDGFVVASFITKLAAKLAGGYVPPGGLPYSWNFVYTDLRGRLAPYREAKSEAESKPPSVAPAPPPPLTAEEKQGNGELQQTIASLAAAKSMDPRPAPRKPPVLDAGAQGVPTGTQLPEQAEITPPAAQPAGPQSNSPDPPKPKPTIVPDEESLRCQLQVAAQCFSFGDRSPSTVGRVVAIRDQARDHYPELARKAETLLAKVRHEPPH